MTSDPRFDAQFALGYESKRSAWWMQDRRTISELDPDPLAGGDGRSSRGTTVAPATTVAGRAAGAVSYTTRFHHQHDPMAVQASRSDPVGRPTPGDEGRGLRGGNPRSLMVQERITREEAERRRAQELLASMGRGGVSTITPVGGDVEACGYLGGARVRAGCRSRSRSFAGTSYPSASRRLGGDTTSKSISSGRERCKRETRWFGAESWRESGSGAER